jgi:hypothetical protein
MTLGGYEGRDYGGGVAMDEGEEGSDGDGGENTDSDFDSDGGEDVTDITVTAMAVSKIS